MLYSKKWDRLNRNIPQNGLILHVHPGMFDSANPAEQTGITKTAISDLSSLEHSGSLQNFDTLASNVHKGNNTIDKPYAINCDGVDDRLSFPDHSAWGLTNELTFAFWIKPTGWGASDFPRLLERWSYSIYFAKSDGSLKIKLDANTYSSDPSAFAIGVWQFFTATWNNTLPSSHVKLYKNGVMIKELDTHTNPLNIITTSDLHIMNRYDSARGFQGELGPFYIYNRALSSNEATQLYNQRPILRKNFVV